MSFETLTLTQSGGVARLALNRPDRLNSFNTVQHEEFLTALRRVATDTSVRAVLLTGAGRAFCAGQDLSDTDENGDVSGLANVLEGGYNVAITLITGMDKPVVCAVNGVAAGAGANIALACDVVIAGASASFVQAFSKIGLVPDAGGTWILPRLIGPARASAIAMLGQPIKAQQAADWGMIWQCVPDETLAADSEALAAQLANQATTALAYTKRLLQISWRNSLTEQLAAEAKFQDAAEHTRDFREGVAAFKEKREAQFNGT
jgi:2-(1,2-epoxy-1,2-dihydrophenyl)acetyl-CoA isomerase